jgi:predicted fused transcriptional regulator/phosphomethylpyrimidine kinase
MKQIISKDGVVKCVTHIPYPQDIIRDMKRAGYKIKTVDDDGNKILSKK